MPLKFKPIKIKKVTKPKESKKEKTYRRALEVIQHINCCGTSFAWSVMQEIALYALTGNYRTGVTWPMHLSQKEAIDNPDSDSTLIHPQKNISTHLVNHANR